MNRKYNELTKDKPKHRKKSRKKGNLGQIINIIIK